MSKLCLLLITCLFCSIALSQKKKLVILGSSTAAGVGASHPDSSWARRLSYYYKEIQNIADTIINLAVPGSELYSAMPTSFMNPPDRVPPDPNHNITAAMTYSPDIVLVSFGGENYDVYSNEELRAVMQTIMDSAVAKGAICYVTTNKPRSDLSAATRLELSQIKDSILLWFKDQAINFWDSIADPLDNTIAAQYRFSGDNIHINNAGHEVLYRQVVAKEIFSAALPISIKNANAQLKNNHAVLSWDVVDEEPNVIYSIQKNAEQTTFKTIGEIKGVLRNHYTFEDADAVKGFTQYRIKVTLPTRTFYSKTLVVDANDNTLLLTCYPTPVSNFLTVDVIAGKQELAELSIVNASGIVMLKRNQSLFKSRNLLLLDVTKLPRGFYTIRLVLLQSRRTFVRPFTRN